MPQSRLDRKSETMEVMLRPQWMKTELGAHAYFAAIGILALCTACAAPVGVQRVSPREAQAELTQSVLTNGKLSERSRILLRRINREQQWETDPAAVLADLHEGLARPVTEFNAEMRASLLDSVAELAFAHASATGDRRYYLAAALYAWLYLFPEDESLRPSAVDRGVRLAVDLYNRGLTLAFTNVETGEVVPEDVVHELPFGRLTIDFDEESLVWGNRQLNRFVSVADLEVRGINNRYRVSGLGAPLAARVSEPAEGEDDLVFGGVRVPVSAVMRFENAESALVEGEYVASLSVIPYSAAEDTWIEGREVPIEFEPTAALALQLAEDPPWKRELKGFFQGDLGIGRLGLVSLSPYTPGRIPFVLVHGTASSAGRWADLLNDLESDRVLRRHYQFWLFTYNTGNPIAYSGWLLRDAIAKLVQSVDAEDRDPVLHDIVVMGHSQGGLLTKLLAVDSGDRFWKLVTDEPPDQIELEPENRRLLEGSLLVEPSPYVGRVIFLSTPHRGSRLATLGPARLLGRLVRAPANVVSAVGELFSDDPATDVQDRLARAGGSIGNMSPSSPFIQTLAKLPIAPGIHAHSIMGVKKGPKEGGSDGVVSYESAHLDDVESELVVQSGHSSQSNPDVVNEVRRILIEHLAEAIDAGIVPPLESATPP
jgi:triacylglycerol esterase/lipase EstA (alpha/beta hydrolase family)